jgi:endonuclease YncB( thermonuclease family)
MTGFVWVYPAVVDHVYDGDTIYMTIDQGFHHHLGAPGDPIRCRVIGINAPEMDTPEGVAARDFAMTLLAPAMPVIFTSRKLDQYGRPLGDITLPGGRDFGRTMLEAGHAVVYS